MAVVLFSAMSKNHFANKNTYKTNHLLGIFIFGTTLRLIIITNIIIIIIVIFL